MRISPIARLGDRIVDRLAPKATAQAMPVGCGWQSRCNGFVGQCATTVWFGMERRRVCDGTGGTTYGPWQHWYCGC
ncbi:hypothetical protein DFP74_4988 [Nocardiopsis sp. Huas11]|uniref:hypothetical protein n=1 Tax=Nocardiopsis sp. Huas11 TaxID=2183912 RepID=UPI000EB3D48D|nr:hypothetical protein [Nocardiopsis sp. Huas11]RKS09255.1 hypothetical protein DFP74_4988 [Nocardiopsis sp. Huas11]